MSGSAEILNFSSEEAPEFIRKIDEFTMKCADYGTKIYDLIDLEIESYSDAERAKLNISLNLLSKESLGFVLAFKKEFLSILKNNPKYLKHNKPIRDSEDIVIGALLFVKSIAFYSPTSDKKKNYFSN